MKKIIKIAHLYYDLMNLYGESGNVKALKRFIERQGVECEVHFLTIGDEINFKKYDFYYIGQGSEKAQDMVLHDLFPYSHAIKEAIKDGKMFLATGNAMELFGTRMRIKDGKPVPCLNIFDFNSNEAYHRLVSDMFYDFDELPVGKGRKVLAFKNCNTNIMNNENVRPFKFSDNIHYIHFFGVMSVGPLLIRNPYFTDYLLEELFTIKGYEYTPHTDTIEYKAYHEFVENVIINNNLD